MLITRYICKLQPAGIAGRFAVHLRTLKSADDASVAVEFAFLGALFILLFASILQVFFLDAMSKNLEENLQRSARSIYTGQFQADNKAATKASERVTALKKEICNADKSPIFNCGDLRIDVRSSQSFKAGTLPIAIDSATKDWKSNFGSNFDCVGGNSIVVVTAAVRQPIPLPLISFGFPEFADRSRLLQSTVVLRTESFGSSASSCQ